jgi:ATP-binding cassette subfamily F protein uup
VWKEYAGGYEDWLRCRKEAASAAKLAPARVAEAKATAKPKSDKLTWKEQRELEALPERIATLEAEQTTLTRRLEDPALHAQPGQEAAAIAARLGAIDEELLNLLERWEALEARV